MGNFYVNFTARGADQAAVVASLRSAGRKAFVGPTLDGITVFYDEESDSQDDAAIRSLGEKVSRDFGGPVLCVLNHDDDILCYWLFQAGKLLDEYNSWPGYFTGGDTTPTGGDAKQLCAAFGVPKRENDVEQVLRDEDYVFALERHEALCRLLQHPWDYAYLGYRYIDDGSELPDGIRAEDLVRIA